MPQIFNADYTAYPTYVSDRHRLDEFNKAKHLFTPTTSSLMILLIY